MNVRLQELQNELNQLEAKGKLVARLQWNVWREHAGQALVTSICFALMLIPAIALLLRYRDWVWSWIR